MLIIKININLAWITTSESSITMFFLQEYNFLSYSNINFHHSLSHTMIFSNSPFYMSFKVSSTNIVCLNLLGVYLVDYLIWGLTTLFSCNFQHWSILWPTHTKWSRKRGILSSSNIQSWIIYDMLRSFNTLVKCNQAIFLASSSFVKRVQIPEEIENKLAGFQYSKDKPCIRNHFWACLIFKGLNILYPYTQFFFWEPPLIWMRTLITSPKEVEFQLMIGLPFFTNLSCNSNASNVLLPFIVINI